MTNPEAASSQASSSPPAVSTEGVREELARILEDTDFRRSERLCAFLAYVVEETLAGRSDRIKQYTVATEVFNRGPKFNPQSDPVVRIQGARLRRALERYYHTAGAQNPVRIAIPRGTYVPVFNRGDATRHGRRQTDRPNDTRGEPRIGVLPFEFIGAPGTLGYLADGLPEELVAELSRFAGLKVTAFASTRALSAGDQSEQSIGETLGCCFVLAGRLKVRGDRLRILVSVTRSADGLCVWTQRFERQLDAASLFEFEDEVVRAVVGVVADYQGVVPRDVVEASRGKRVNDLNAYEGVLRNLHYISSLLPDDFAVALDGLEHAVAIDPEYALAWAMLAQLYLDAEAFGFPGVTDGSSKGMAAARRAVQLDPQSQWAQCSAAYANLVQGDAEAVCRHSRCAIELNPNSALAVGWAGWSLCAAGEFEEGLAAMGHAIELNPYHPSWYHTAPCFSAMARGAFDEAVEHAGNVGMPGFFWDPLLRAAALGLAGKSQQARGAADELLAINPQFHIDGLNAIRPIVLSEVVRERQVEGMAVAGIVLAPLPVASHHAAGM